MLFFKKLLLFFCVIIVSSSCSTLRNQPGKSQAHQFGWHVNNYDKSKLNYYMATSLYDELICFETIDGVPLCIQINEKTMSELYDSEPYLHVMIYEPSNFGRSTITNYSTLKNVILDTLE